MSLLRNSVIVGGATFLVGSAFMGISKADSKSDIGKWPYIATFLSGALGFYLLKQNFIPVPKALELNADTYISKTMRERHFGKDYREEDLEEIRERWVSGEYDGTPVEMPDGSYHTIGTSWVEDKIPLIYHTGAIDPSFREDELYQTYFPTSVPLPKNAEYDFQNQAITTVIADNEDDAYEELAIGDLSDEDWEIVDIRDAEELQSFAAEVFMADRKIRRRTRWTWTRSMEDGFDYSNIPYTIDSWNYRQDGAYHISDLPEGYHLHLYKPKKRSRQWIAYAKHPQSDKWDKFYARNKAYLTPQLLEWYNLSIATPTKQEMSPIMQMLIDTGSASGDVKISRVVIPEVPRMRKMPDGTKQKVGVLTSEQIKFYATKPNEKPQILATKSGSGYDFSMSENGFERLGVLAFMQGLAFIGSQAGTTRSVNRFNKNPEAWVKSYPAWFQNTVKNKINHLRIKIRTMNRFNNILSKGSNIEIFINNVTVATLNRGEKFYSRQTPTNNTKWIEDFELLSEPKIKVMGEEYPPIFILNEDGEFEQPRPSTQRKIYQNSMILQDDGTYQINHLKFLMEITDRYKFENQTWLNETMSGKRTANLDKQSQEVNSQYQPIMKTMLRRFKKNLN